MGPVQMECLEESHTLSNACIQLKREEKGLHFHVLPTKMVYETIRNNK